MSTPRLLVITLVLWATAAPARAQEEAEPPVSWEIGAVSDYLFRGVSQTDGKPALQGAKGFGKYQGKVFVALHKYRLVAFTA